MRQNVTRSYFATIHEEWALNALLGRPAACLWQTSSIGHIGRLWVKEAWINEEGQDMHEEYPEQEDFFSVDQHGTKSFAAAEKWLQKQMKDLTRN